MKQEEIIATALKYTNKKTLLIPHISNSCLVLKLQASTDFNSNGV